MRILYISGAEGPDYLCDMLFHGLRRLLGPDVVDVNRLWYMYADEFGEGRHCKSDLYGRGFTLYGLLEDDSAVDRTDILQKIKTRYFDLVIFGSILRCQALLPEVLAAYSAKEIVFIDGEDHPLIVSRLSGRGLYFKRELNAAQPGVWPIQFAIPEERIGTVIREKNKILAHIDPRNPATYIYPDERSYYGDYAGSLFGVTMKKAGWDCLRHYEIMANGCIPHFLELDNCPAATMTFLPKEELCIAGNLLMTREPGFFSSGEGLSIWQGLHQKIDRKFRRHGTTLALARYVLETMAHYRAVPVGYCLTSEA